MKKISAITGSFDILSKLFYWMKSNLEVIKVGKQ